jgi:predicted nucleotide-binding protein (sugar kinase/HSP70/actin superfamily)
MILENKKKLSKPYNTLFTKRDKKKRTLIIPNLSHSFSVISASVVRGMGYNAIALPFANDEAKKLGKAYVHNDACFPAQVNVGEFLYFFKKNSLNPSQIACVLAKNCKDCRAGQYSVLTRKALDMAGFNDVAIVTSGEDTKKIHPGFKANLFFQWKMLWGIVIIDLLDYMLRATRPYENVLGETDKLYEYYLEKIAKSLEKGVKKALNSLDEAVLAFNSISVNNTLKKPKVFIIGEILLNYHDTANRNLVKYLEKNGMEVIIPDMINFFWRQFYVDKIMATRKMIKNSFLIKIRAIVFDIIIKFVIKKVNKIAEKFRFYERKPNIKELAKNVDGIIDHSIVAGEGWLIPAEIIHYAKKGVSSFIIVQPFGCLPNHITGRGIIQLLKEKFPQINILSIDYDFDVSMANIENRLQMLLMALKQHS